MENIQFAELFGQLSADCKWIASGAEIYKRLGERRAKRSWNISRINLICQ